MRIINFSENNRAVLDILNRRPEPNKDSSVTLAVNEIINNVRAHGNQALVDYAAKFDQVTLDATSLQVTAAEFDAALSEVPQDFLAALRVAKNNIVEFHQKQLPKDWLDIKNDGSVLGQRYCAVDSAGLYVPGGVGGSTPLVSSLLMNSLPAIVAGVKRIVVCTPPSAGGKINAYLLAAMHECGISEVYKVGGAQAIAAMAYGTETIKSVDVIVGPGNQFVTEAKRQVYGFVGLDMLAGPSEILIIADKDNNPQYVAADLLSQAEHGPSGKAGSFLLTDDADFAQKVAAEVERQLPQLSRREIAVSCLEQCGAIIVVDDAEQMYELSNYAAPEHLELLVADPWNKLNKLRHAGAIFIGPYSTEPIGDYVAGTNHVLPTNGTARFASGLSVDPFIKKSSIISYSREAILQNGPAAVRISEVEGLDAHGNAVKIRLS